MQGYIHSVQSLGTVDGPGIRTVVFMSGCPLRCIYCHNPDTWSMKDGQLREPHELCEQILRFYPYIKNGGVTFSGGEPCMQAEFILESAKLLKEKNIHIALDTSGCVYNEAVDRLLDVADLVLLDIKMTSEEDYLKHTGTKLSTVLEFLDILNRKKKEVWIRHVVVPGLNDTPEDVEKLKKIVDKYSCVTRTELLPFKNLCIEKYESMGIKFKLKDTEPMKADAIKKLNYIMNNGVPER